MKQKKMYPDQLIVITGAGGFIGSSMVRHLNDLGRFNLLLVDDFNKTEKWKNLLGKRFVDIVSKSQFFEYLKNKTREIEAFIHLGACTDTLERDVDYLLENNYRFSIRLVEYALENDHRFIYCSTAATYGDGSLGFSDEVDLDNLKPINTYAFSKHLFDLWARNEKILDKVIGLKYFNIFGPNEYHKGHMASMVYKMTKEILQEGKVQLFKSTHPDYADGEQKRDFLYVKDAVRMTCRLLEGAFKEIGGIFNIGSGKAVSWNSLAKAVFRALDKPCKIEYVDMPEGLKSQYQNYTCADMKKYCRLQGIEGEKLPIVSLEKAVKEYVQEYILRNERW